MKFETVLFTAAFLMLALISVPQNEDTSEQKAEIKADTTSAPDLSPAQQETHNATGKPAAIGSIHD